MSSGLSVFLYFIEYMLSVDPLTLLDERFLGDNWIRLGVVDVDSMLLLL